MKCLFQIIILLLQLQGCSYYAVNYYFEDSGNHTGWDKEFIPGKNNDSKAVPTKDLAIYTTTINNCQIDISSSYQLSTRFGLFLIPLVPTGTMEEKDKDLEISFTLSSKEISNCDSIIQDITVTVNSGDVSKPLVKRHETEFKHYYQLRPSYKIGISDTLSISIKNPNQAKSLYLTKKKGQTFVVLATL
jgi:hypothetical protein